MWKKAFNLLLKGLEDLIIKKADWIIKIDICKLGILITICFVDFSWRLS